MLFSNLFNQLFSTSPCYHTHKVKSVKECLSDIKKTKNKEIKPVPELLKAQEQVNN